MPERDTAPREQRPLCPFPYALYDSFGLLFELLQGGQTARPKTFISPEARSSFVVLEGGAGTRAHQVQWQRLSPVPENQHPNPIHPLPQVQP